MSYEADNLAARIINAEGIDSAKLERTSGLLTLRPEVRRRMLDALDAFPAPGHQTVCEQCGSLFLQIGDDWYRIERMHDDRVGLGPIKLCSKECASAWLADQ